MHWLPYETWEFDVRAPPEELAERLAENVDPGFLVFMPRQLLRGKVHAGGFELARNLGYRNSWSPVLVGGFLPTAGGTRVRVSLRLAYGVTLFMVIWCAMPAVIFLIGVPLAIMGQAPWAMPLIPFALLLVGYGIALGAFWFEVPYSKAAFWQALGSDGSIPAKDDQEAHSASVYVREDEI